MRGEDSFIRAHWAAKNRCYGIFTPQDEDAHLDKLAAWQQLSQPFIDQEWQQLQQAWVKQDTNPEIWQTLLSTTAQSQQKRSSTIL